GSKRVMQALCAQGGFMKFLSIIESILKSRSKRRKEVQSGRLIDEFAEAEFQESLEVARKFEPKTYDKYKG
ncbi:hypothetical protein, partial [Aliivibrio fischeri]|uniref:hypothetical protein n=1 Tax=Aliivibrio fischeri TaxID=668 RepID=UPI001BE3DA2D